ncbi:pancreatic triacylglycerol lipase-like [Cydia pomonella]|uniref:pancreatic triacylglycerol lipase-like n=1 Tax=Cydia pomonella TaxID=82600 RepID=UPI002ADE448E|nr:pancreatic triacylglycerol lipase-like [Cydia pomonella]
MNTMLRHAAILLVCLFGLGAALPPKPILRKLDDLRYQHARDSAGNYHLVDMWMTLDDILDVARFDPLASNVYHLFTRDNPSVSQPLLINNAVLLQTTNFSNSRRTIVLIHGWRDGGVVSPFVTNLVPAFLAAEDVNVIVVDWSAGSSSLFASAIDNTVSSGRAVAAFINWLNQETFSSPVQYHIVGHGMGGHQAGVVGRTLGGNVAYVTGLDPSLVGWINHPDRFQETDAIYTEVIHTNCGINGYLSNLAHVDFYPNGGESMPGCDSHACDHERAIHYFAESVVSGGFTGRQCINYLAAVLQQCNLLPLRLQMGGLRPKISSTGVFLLETNAAPPFSQG